MSDSDDNLDGVPLIDDSGSSDHDIAPKVSSKRKRGDDVEVAGKSSKPKTKKAKRAGAADLSGSDEHDGIDHSIAQMNPSLLADHFAQRTKRFRPDMSLVEADDARISEKSILDTTSFSSQRKAEHLPEFLKTFVSSKTKDKAQKLSNAPNSKGSPHTLVIAASGIRAADITRPLREFQTKNSMVAKLFAKHIKLKEAIETTKKTRMGIGVGTPQRLIDLIENDALKIEHLERIVIDASYSDQKRHTILDIKEVQIALTALLTRAELKERYVAEKHRVKLLFF